MNIRNIAIILSLCIAATIGVAAAERDDLSPRGRIHIPIGIADTVDTLKTFVEAEGSFSPGVGSFGVYFWIFDNQSRRLTAPTMDSAKCEHGLAEGKYLIPWSKWAAGDINVKTELCQVKRTSPKGDVFIVGSRVIIENTTSQAKDISLYAAIRPVGAAGFAIKEMTVSPGADALLVEGHPAIVAGQAASGTGVLPEDTVGELAIQGRTPGQKHATSQDGNCSGALRFDMTVRPRVKHTYGFVCPVLPGRRAVGHKWDGVADWAQFDLAELNPPASGQLQPDPGLDYYRRIDVSQLFDEANEYWAGLVERVKLALPERKWEEAFCAIIGHAAIEMNEGAPDVAVVNYNVFNRDGVYVANIFQKSANADLAAAAIDYFTRHPFNGRSYPEADNPGQILWAMSQQWRFERDEKWARRIWPSAKRIAEMIKYYRTTNGPHWVQMDGLDFGEAVAKQKKRQLKPGRCDGHHPEYTEAFDIAGLRAAAELAEAVGKQAEAKEWRELAERLLEVYDEKFASDLARAYGSYSVLWPCRLYPIVTGKAYERFKAVGNQNPSGWRYFPLATAHQGLLTGNREAGYKTLEAHLNHEQMRGWYAFDEGGKSGSGGWGRVRTTWNGDVAMPHGWAIAEVWLLLRDSLLFEDGDRLILFGGVPPQWFKDPKGMEITGAPTYFGDCSVKLESTEPLQKLFTRFEFHSLLREFSAEPMGGGDGGGLELVFKKSDPKRFLQASRKAASVSVAAGKPVQPDLLHGSSVMVALALPDGRAAVYADADLERNRAALAKLLAAPKPAKCGHDVKAVLRLLRESGLDLSAPESDTMLAAYCLDPSRGRYGLEDVLMDMGAGKLPAEEPAAGLARRAAAVWPVRERLEAEIKDRGLEGLYRKVELPMVEVLAEMELAGVALDTVYLGKLRVEFEERIAGLKKEIDALAGVEINLRSTKQLGELFYDKLGLPVVHKTKKGGRSTDEEALRSLARLHPIPGMIIEYRELTKLQSTYVIALGEKLDPSTGRVHSHFNQSGTATGRLSSLDPNLQNIPIRTPLGRKIRRAFHAEKGHILLSADYSQIDLRVLAHLSADPALAGAFKKGGDIHRRTAAEVFGVAPDEVDKDMRRRAKAVNFGIVYGQSAHGLAAELEIPRAEAQEIIDRYFATYAGVRRWIDATLESARKDGSVRTLLGRVRELPDIRSRNFQSRSFSERIAMNTPIQGTSADIIKAAMIAIHKEMTAKRSWQARLILQVHDELVFELPEAELSRFGLWVRREMEEAVPLDVPLIVDLKAGPNWLEMEDVPA